MADWTVCPECNLKHSIRPDGICPRCNASVDGGGGPPPQEGAAPPPVPEAPPIMPEGADIKTVAIPLGCPNHPQVFTGLMRCDQCGRTFCSDCVVAMADGVFCAGCRSPEDAAPEPVPAPPPTLDPAPAATFTPASAATPPPTPETTPAPTPEQAPAPTPATAPAPIDTPTPPRSARKLTVMEGLRAGWKVATADIWKTWLIAFVFLVITSVAGLPGIIPLVGTLWVIAFSFVVAPQLQAGLVLAVMQKIDGGEPNIETLFEGFKKRFGSSIVVMLPIWAVTFVFMVVMFGVLMLFGGLGALVSADSPSAEPSALIGVVMTGLMLVFMLLIGLVSMVMWFGYVALWEGHESGVAALTAGWRVVRDNLVPTILLLLMVFLVVLGASLAGMLALCVGYLFTMPVAMIWVIATTVILYRSWSATPTSQ